MAIQTILVKVSVNLNHQKNHFASNCCGKACQLSLEEVKNGKSQNQHRTTTYQSLPQELDEKWQLDDCCTNCIPLPPPTSVDFIELPIEQPPGKAWLVCSNSSVTIPCRSALSNIESSSVSHETSAIRGARKSSSSESGKQQPQTHIIHNHGLQKGQ